MGVFHIVLFEFKPTTTRQQVLQICQSMLSLADECIHPTTKKPYVKTSAGGRDNSPEGHQGGFSHGFVMEFNSVEDRDYYVNQDLVHKEFIKSAEPHIQNVRVVDFEPGKF